MNLKKPRKNIYKILDSASHMKGVLNAVNEGIITFNSKLKIVMINRFALNLWGYSRDEILGGNLSKLIAKPYSTRIKEYTNKNILSEKLNSLNKNVKIKGLRKNNTKFPIGLNFVEHKIDQEIFYTVAITDLTENLKNKEIQNCILKISNSIRISTNIRQLYRDIYKNLSALIPAKHFTISLVLDKNNVEEYNYSDTKSNYNKKRPIKWNIIEPIIKKRKPLIYCYEQIYKNFLCLLLAYCQDVTT